MSYLPIAGERFLDRYEIQRILGRGGFAIVYHGVDEVSRREVAIKILDPGERGYSADMQSRFMREVQVLSSLRDPHTITMFDFGKTREGLLYMIFEYVPGRDLEDVLYKGGRRLTESETLHVLMQLLQSLREAHAAGLLHRDLKPANVRVYEYMGDPLRVKLLDFGIARAAEGDQGRITQAGAMIGTPQFMSPEQVFGGNLTAASDIYSLGLVTMEMLTGRPAVDGGTGEEILRKQVADEPLRLPADVSVSPRFRAIVEQMVARRPSERFQSAAQVMRAIDVMFDEADVVAPPSSPPSPSAHAGPREPTQQWSTPAGPVACSGEPSREMIVAQRRPKATSTVLTALTLSLVVGLVGGGVLLLGSDDATDRPVPTPPPRAEAAVEASLAEPKTEETIAAPGDAEFAPAFVATHEEVHTAQASALAMVRGGCGIEHGSGTVGDRMGGFLPYGGWVTYVPQSYDPYRRHPVVFFFHDSRTGSPSSFLSETKLQHVADDKGFLIVVPEGASPANKFLGVPLQPLWAEPSALEFVLALFRTIRETHCVDDAKVYLVGTAMGATLADEVACRVRVSAVAGVSNHGDQWSRRCIEESPTPYLLLSGKRDGYNPLGGGSTCGFNATSRPSRAARVQQLAEMNECEGEPKVSAKTEDYTCEAHKGCEAPLVTCLHDYGHDWPARQLTSLEIENCRGPAMGFPAAELVWQFFEEHGQEADLLELDP